MDMALTMAAYNGLKFAKDSLTTLVQGKVEIESQAKIIEALEKLGPVQDALFEMRQDIFDLQTENQRLKSALEQSKKWDDKLANYELVMTDGGAVAHRFKGSPLHYLCPSCINKKQPEILQDNRNLSGKFRCTACNAEYPINPRKSIPVEPIRRSANPYV
ncbi:hypothetical protein [Pseudoduganella sp. R-34]|uniref:hypothetical protein n=1 Tax=Pseudoduganella sp. R-34 TaxID=3404062 RepID=UPI003CE88271